MGAMAVLVIAVVGVVLVVGIALLAVGSAVRRLGPEPERQVFTSDEALGFVAEALPESVTAELSFEDVQRIMRLHLDFLHRRGVSRSGGDLPDGDGPVVLEIEDGATFVIERAALVGFRPAREHVVDVITAQLAYFEAIGAMSMVEGPDLSVGPRVSDDAPPGDTSAPDAAQAGTGTADSGRPNRSSA